MPVPEPKAVEIYGREIKPKVGDYIVKAGKLIGECLKPGDEPIEGRWAGSQFRWSERRNYAAIRRATGQVARG
jgi:hypothetical protein